MIFFKVKDQKPTLKIIQISYYNNKNNNKVLMIIKNYLFFLLFFIKKKKDKKDNKNIHPIDEFNLMILRNREWGLNK